MIAVYIIEHKLYVGRIMVTCKQCSSDKVEKKNPRQPNEEKMYPNTENSPYMNALVKNPYVLDGGLVKDIFVSKHIWVLYKCMYGEFSV